MHLLTPKCWMRVVWVLNMGVSEIPIQILVLQTLGIIWGIMDILLETEQIILNILEYQLQEMIGLIIPPGDIKSLIETTAAWVAENGANFQDYIIEKSKNDTKFSFLNTTHPYRGYFDSMVQQYQNQLLPQPQPKQEVEEVVKKQQPNPILESAVDDQQKQFLERVFKEVRVPDPDIYYVEIPEKLTLLDIDIMEHTAQYVAKNGKKFLEALGERQKSNPQFQFLKSTSSNHKYFLALIQGYTRILQIKLSDIQKYPLLQESKEDVLIRCSQKYEYEASQQKLKKTAKANVDVEEDDIDWNDFELVETLEFDDEYQDASKNATSIDHLTELMRKKLNQQTHQGYNKPIQSIIAPSSKSKEIMQSCVSCGKNIPVSQINSHIKTCMLDPREKARRLDLEKKIVQAGNEVNIHQNINSMLSRSYEGTKVNAIFDGQNPNITRTTGSIAMMENQKRKLTQSLQKNQKK